MSFSRSVQTALAWTWGAVFHAGLQAKVAFGVVATLLLFYLFFFNYVEQYQVGLGWNPISGEVFLQRSGMHITAPWTTVSRIDTRPHRLCVESAGRGFNCKLVRFVPEQYREFVATEGHYYYWWANRFSFNSGYHNEYRGMNDLLRGYAYSSASNYKFVEVLIDTQQQP